jgi:hypothetical protein
MLLLGVVLILLSAIPPRRDVSNAEWDKQTKNAARVLGKEITWKIYAIE